MSERSKKTDNEKLNDMSIEESFEYLDELLDRLQDDEVPLEEAFALYEQGMKVVKVCSDKIDTVEKKVKLIDAKGNQRELEDLE